jgi:hypothetical protein
MAPRPRDAVGIETRFLVKDEETAADDETVGCSDPRRETTPVARPGASSDR